jgi:hypothetical protein
MSEATASGRFAHHWHGSVGYSASRTGVGSSLRHVSVTGRRLEQLQVAGIADVVGADDRAAARMTGHVE